MNLKNLRATAARKSAGFTLIELAVVVAIIGLLLGGLLLPLATQVDARKVETAEDDLDEIKDALYGYMISNNATPLPGDPLVVTRLPCPDCVEATDGNCGTLPAIQLNDGQEDFFTTTTPPIVTQCAFTQVNVPWVTLGVTQLDSWNRNYRYIVSDGMADDDPDCVGTTTSLGLCSTGDLTILDSAGNNVALNMAAVVLSLGDGVSRTLCSEAADPSPTQDENVDCDTTFVSNTRIDAAGVEFDDVVMWVSPNIIKSKLMEVNILP